MKRVLLVAANQERLPDPVAPLGTACVAGAIRARGHPTRIFDACFSADAPADLGREIADFSPEVIGLSLRNVDNVAFPNVVSYLEGQRELALACRRLAPSAVLFAGGSAFSLFPEEYMRELEADLGVIGEGEEVFPRLVDEIDRHGRVVSPSGTRWERIHRGAPLDPGLCPPPATDLIDARRYFAEGGSLNVQTKRGCPFGCIYCSYPLLEGRAVRVRAASAAVDEMARLRRDHGADVLFFVDNVFNGPPDHAREVCEEILRRDLRIGWTAYVTPAGLDRELLELMRRSGCRSLELGVDSLSDAQLRRLGKPFDAAQVIRASGWCRETGIRFGHSLIFGGPGETWDTARETVENVRRSLPNAAIAVIGVRVLAGTPLAREMIGRGEIAPEGIGLDPVFFVSDEVREGIAAFLSDVASRCPNWIIPGLGKNMNARYFRRVRSRGVKGPLWELFDPVAADGAVP